MTVRVQVVLDEREREAFRRQARQEGQSLSAWLREAGRARLKEGESKPQFSNPEALAEFFARCDDNAGSGVEPDWAEHRRVLEDSRRQGLPEA